MPTGYTADLYDGKDVTFEHFVMRCARNFGALILMRDDNLDAPIEENRYTQGPDSYYAQALATAKDELAAAQALTDDRAAVLAQQEYDKAERAYAKAVEKDAALRARYEAMLERVRAWEPPTPDHQGLKDFMVSQLEESIRFDCTTLNRSWYGPRAVRTPAEYRAAAIEKAAEAITRAEQELAKERERDETRIAWVTALQDSLGASVPERMST